MKFDELMARRPNPPKNADEFWQMTQDLIGLEDITDDERSNFQAAFLTGASWMLAMGAEGRLVEGGEKTIQLYEEWTGQGVFG